MMAGRFLLGILFVVAGSLHFFFPKPYIQIVPPFLPLPRLVVLISGMAEIAGGVGLTYPTISAGGSIRIGPAPIGRLPCQYLYGGGSRSISRIVGNVVGPVAEASASNTAHLVGFAIYEE
jgi:hypothetical protein